MEAVSDEDLSGASSQLLGDLDQGLVVRFLISDDGRVGFDHDVAFGAVVDDGALLAPGVELGTGRSLASGVSIKLQRCHFDSKMAHHL